MDLVSAAELEAVASAVRRVNGSALMLRATNAELPLEQLLGLHAFSTARWQQALQGNLVKGALAKAAHGGGGVNCVCLRSAVDLDLDRLQAWMQRALLTVACSLCLTHRDLPRLTATHRDLPRLTTTYRDLLRLTLTYHDLP